MLSVADRTAVHACLSSAARCEAPSWFRLLCLTVALLVGRAVDFVLPSQPTSQETAFPCRSFLAWSLSFTCRVGGGCPRLLLQHPYSRVARAAPRIHVLQGRWLSITRFWLSCAVKSGAGGACRCCRGRRIVSGEHQPPALGCTALPSPGCFGSARASLSSGSHLPVPGVCPRTTLEALYLPKLFVGCRGLGCARTTSSKCKDQPRHLGQRLKVSFSSC